MGTAVDTARPLATPTAQAGQLTRDSYKGKIHPDWCPGCGDFSVLSALQTALFDLGLKPQQVLVVSGIGCSSNLPGFLNAYGMHTLHGRSLAVATGAKLGNHQLTVIATGGGGDGYGGCGGPLFPFHSPGTQPTPHGVGEQHPWGDARPAPPTPR